jgi:hypothetical protein
MFCLSIAGECWRIMAVKNLVPVRTLVIRLHCRIRQYMHDFLKPVRYCFGTFKCWTMPSIYCHRTILNAACVSYQHEFIVTHACRKTRRGEHKSNENKGQGRNRKGRRVFTTHDMFPQRTNQRRRSLASGQKNDELHGTNVGCGHVEYIHQPSSEFRSKKSQL